MDVPLAERFPPQALDRSRQAAPQVADILREWIMALTLPPGTVLPRNELAARFAISQTPVRDALARLSDEGLVDIFPQHATRVSRIDVSSALQTHFLRRSLELEVVRMLALCSPAQVSEIADALRARIAEQELALLDRDFDRFGRADQAFHLAMFDAAGMASLWALVRQRSGHIDRLRRLHLPEAGKARSVIVDHQSIVAAIQTRDPAAAQEALRSHLSGTLAFVEHVRAQHPHWIHG
jgi:DNA-binding GntR family transcriptional regulator